MWALVIAGIGAAASTFNAIDEAVANRAIRKALKEIILYLNELNQKLDKVIAQNQEILRRLDELPRIIRAIVQEIVDEALLNERYAIIHTIKLNITTLNLDRHYRITAAGWKDLSSALTYLFLHENRISQLFRLILASELALAATRNHAKPFIQVLLEDKIYLLKALHNDYINTIVTELNALRGLLNNKEYIFTHNLSEDLDKFENLKYERQSDRLRTINYTERECQQKLGRCGETYEVCRDVAKSRQEADTPFHSARDNHIAVVAGKVGVISAMLIQLGYLSAIIKRLEKYLATVNSMAAASTEVLLFHEKAGARTISMRRELPTLSNEELRAYHYYSDDLPDAARDVLATRSNPAEEGAFAVVTGRCPDI